MPPNPKPAPAPKPLTKEQIEIVDLFYAWTVSERTSQEKAADILGWSVGVLNAMFKHSYTGRVEDVVAAMKEHLDRVRSEDLAIKRPPFMELNAATKVFRFCTECRDSRVMGYIWGRKGVGKTMALQAFAEAHSMSAIHIICFKGFTSRALLAALCKRLGVAWPGSEADAFPLLVAALKQQGHPLLIVDDCDFLKNGIHSARQLCDPEQGNCGLVLSGTEVFLRWLRDHDDGTEGQAYSRIAAVLKLDAITYDDGERLANFYGITSVAWRKCWDACGKNARRLVWICMRAARFAAGGEVTEQHVDNAIASLLPAELKQVG